MPNKKNISKNDKKLLKNEKVYVSILAIKHAFSISGRKEYMRYDDVIRVWNNNHKIYCLLLGRSI